MDSSHWKLLLSLFIGIQYYVAKVAPSPGKQSDEEPLTDEKTVTGSFLLLQYLAEAYPTTSQNLDFGRNGKDADKSVNEKDESSSSQGCKSRSSIPAWKLEETDSYFPPFSGDALLGAQDDRIVIPKPAPSNSRKSTDINGQVVLNDSPIGKSDLHVPRINVNDKPDDSPQSKWRDSDDSDFNRDLPKYGPPQLWKLLDHYREYLGLRYRLPFLIPEDRPTKPMKIPIKRRPLAEICALIETYPAEFEKFNFSALKRIAVLLAAVSEDPHALDFLYDYKKGLVVSHLAYWLYLLSPTDPKHYELANVLTATMTVFIRHDLIAQGGHKALLEYSQRYGSWLRCPNERIVRNIMMVLIGIYRYGLAKMPPPPPSKVDHNRNLIAILVDDVIPKYPDLHAQLLAQALLKLIVNVNYDTFIHLVPTSLQSFIK